MLKEKLPEIISIKLTNGDELIATLVSFEAGELTIDHPLTMTFRQETEEEQPHVIFVPWLMAANTTNVRIREQHILILTTPREDAAENYAEVVKMF